MAAPSAIEPRKNLETVRDLLLRSRAQLQAALPRHMTVDRLLRVALTCIQRTPRLAECHPMSLLGAIMECAQLGLEPDPVQGKAYLVPFWNSKAGYYEVQFIPGYKGLMDLALRSRQVRKIEAHEVREHDQFDYAYGDQPFLQHKPARTNRGAIVAAYAIAWYADGAKHFWVSERDEIEKARNRSKAKDDGPWKTDEEWMSLKTAVRRLCKFLPQTPELGRAVALDELSDVQEPQYLELVADQSLTAPVERPHVVQPTRTPTPAPTAATAPAPTAGSAPQAPAPVAPGSAATVAPAPGNGGSLEPISEAARRRLYAIAKHRTKEELHTYVRHALLAKYGVEIGADVDPVSQIPKADYETMCRWAESKG